MPLRAVKRSASEKNHPSLYGTLRTAARSSGGYAASAGEFTAGGHAIAAAILDSRGRPVAALHVSFPRGRFSPELEERCVSTLVEGTRAIATPRSRRAPRMTWENARPKPRPGKRGRRRCVRSSLSLESRRRPKRPDSRNNAPDVTNVEGRLGATSAVRRPSHSRRAMPRVLPSCIQAKRMSLSPDDRHGCTWFERFRDDLPFALLRPAPAAAALAGLGVHHNRSGHLPCSGHLV